MKTLVLVLAAIVVALIVWFLIDSDGMSTTIATWLRFLYEWRDRLAPDLTGITSQGALVTSEP